MAKKPPFDIDWKKIAEAIAGQEITDEMLRFDLAGNVYVDGLNAEESEGESEEESTSNSTQEDKEDASASDSGSPSAEDDKNKTSEVEREEISDEDKKEMGAVKLGKRRASPLKDRTEKETSNPKKMSLADFKNLSDEEMDKVYEKFLEDEASSADLPV